MTPDTSLTASRLERYTTDGYLIEPGLFGPGEVTALIDNFMEMHGRGSIPGCFEAVSPAEAGGDILRMFPRMMHPHRVNDTALRYLPRRLGSARS